MGRSKESFNKKEVRKNKEKKKKDKESRRLARKEHEKSGCLDDMIAYVDEYGRISSTPPDPDKNKHKTKLKDIEISPPKKTDQPMHDTVKNGIVSFYNESKGYGFIKDLESRNSIFFHASNLLEPVSENDSVLFEIEKSPKRLTAIKVKRNS